MKSANRLGIFLRSLFLHLTVFFLPTQLAFHFWPDFSYVYGIRVDYLSPAIYFTDLLIIGYLAFSFKEISRIIKNKNILSFLVILLIIVVFNIAFAGNAPIAVIRWLKIIEVILFAVVLKYDQNLKKESLLKTLFISSFLFGIVAFFQIIKNQTLGGIFYFFGERSFNIQTPGISTASFFGEKILRAYGTFPHPNSLAGYYGLVILLLMFFRTKEKKEKLIKIIFFVFFLLIAFLSFSKNLLFAFLVVGIFYKLIIKKHTQNDKDRPLLGKILKIVFILTVIVSLFFPVVSSSNIVDKLSIKDYSIVNIDYSKITERCEMYKISGYVIADNFITGVGLNNFIAYLPNVYFYKIPLWQLQPVHNIFLLLLSESGILVFVFVLMLVIKYIDYLINKKLIVYLLVLFAIISTGLFDHYWITLQQNLLLMFFLLGISLNEQKL